MTAAEQPRTRWCPVWPKPVEVLRPPDGAPCFPAPQLCDNKAPCEDALAALPAPLF